MKIFLLPKAAFENPTSVNEDIPTFLSSADTVCSSPSVPVNKHF